MNSWIGRFLDYLKYERNYSVNTIAFYRQSLRNFVDYLEREIGFGAASEVGWELDVQHIDADIVRGWIISLMERGYKRGSVHGMLSSLKSFFKFLRKEGVVSANPAALVKGPKCEKPLPYFIKDATTLNTDLVINTYFIISVPFIYFYNGNKGSDNKILQKAFYLFYPIHLVIIFLITYLVSLI